MVMVMVMVELCLFAGSLVHLEGALPAAEEPAANYISGAGQPWPDATECPRTRY